MQQALAVGGQRNGTPFQHPAHKNHSPALDKPQALVEFASACEQVRYAPAANHSPHRGGVRQRCALAVGGQRNGT